MELGRIELVTVPVTDQDRAKAYYVEGLGFIERFDYVMEAEEAGGAGAGARWLMLAPPGGGADILLSTWSTPPGTAFLALGCADADAAYAGLAARGLPLQDEPRAAAWGRWFGLEDPDGNHWLIVQS